MTAAESSGLAGGAVPVVTAEPPRGRRTVLVPLLVALSTVALGVGVGLLWRVLAPRMPVRKLEQGFAYLEAQPEQPVAADGWFAFLGLAAGVLAALVAWFALRHRRGALVMAGLVLGSLVGGWLGWWLGVRLEFAAFEAVAASTPVGGRLEAPLSLGITQLNREHSWPVEVDSEGIRLVANGVVIIQALAAAFVYTALAGFAADPDLRSRSGREPELAAAAPPMPYPLPEAPGWPTAGPEQAETVRPSQAAPDLSSGPAWPSDPKGPPAPP